MSASSHFAAVNLQIPHNAWGGSNNQLWPDVIHTTYKLNYTENPVKIVKEDSFIFVDLHPC